MSLSRETATVLIEGVRLVLDRVPGAAPFLADLPVAPVSIRTLAPAGLPVLAWMDVALTQAVPVTAPLVRAVAAVAGDLAWRQTYGADDVGPGFLDGYGWTEFVGLQGPIPSTTVACGILMLGPDVAYPAHAHEAEELYLPLAGTARWQRGADEFVARPPGEAIHHPSWLPHAMRTDGVPLLALYVWRGGGLAGKARIVERG